MDISIQTLWPHQLRAQILRTTFRITTSLWKSKVPQIVMTTWLPMRHRLPFRTYRVVILWRQFVLSTHQKPKLNSRQSWNCWQGLRHPRATLAMIWSCLMQTCCPNKKFKQTKFNPSRGENCESSTLPFSVLTVSIRRQHMSRYSLYQSIISPIFQGSSSTNTQSTPSSDLFQYSQQLICRTTLWMNYWTTQHSNAINFLWPDARRKLVLMTPSESAIYDRRIINSS